MSGENSTLLRLSVIEYRACMRCAPAIPPASGLPRSVFAVSLLGKQLSWCPAGSHRPLGAPPTPRSSVSRFALCRLPLQLAAAARGPSQRRQRRQRLSSRARGQCTERALRPRRGACRRSHPMGAAPAGPCAPSSSSLAMTAARSGSYPTVIHLSTYTLMSSLHSAAVLLILPKMRFVRGVRRGSHGAC
jgi:hypothetical protein